MHLCGLWTFTCVCIKVSTAKKVPFRRQKGDHMICVDQILMSNATQPCRTGCCITENRSTMTGFHGPCSTSAEQTSPLVSIWEINYLVEVSIGLSLRVRGVGLGLEPGLGLGLWLGLGVRGLGFRGLVLGVRVRGLGFRVKGLGLGLGLGS